MTNNKNIQKISDLNSDEKAQILINAPESLFKEIIGIPKPKDINDARIYAETIFQKSEEVIVRYLRSKESS